MRIRTTLVSLILASASTFPAAACDVGTPNQEASWLITHNDIGLGWTQTEPINPPTGSTSMYKVRISS
jgi:hypothetical protein